MIRRLKIKFICVTMTIITVLLCVIFGLIIHFTQQNLENQSLQAMQALASGPVIPGKPGEMPHELRIPYFILQVSPTGESAVISSGNYDLSDTESLKQILSKTLSSSRKTGILPDFGLRFFKANTPAGQKLVFADISADQAMITDLVRTCVLIGVLSLSLFFGISILLARWAIRPVEQAWNQQRQFVADASHELKTPLTVIMTNAELLQDPGYDDAARRQFSGSILTMSRQMRGLVEGLLDLARADNGSSAMDFSLLDFSQLAGDAVLPFEPLYFEQGLTLESSIESGIRLSGSARHLQQAVDILLDNAAKYTFPGSTVTVTLKKQGRHCLLAVSNPGESISPQDLKNIFKRFYRTDKARAINGSYGLGLSIAESIVREHRGRIWAQSENGCNTFFIQLPCE